MRLWVADNVLCDYTCGVVFIHAETEQEAIDTFMEQDPFHFRMIMGTSNCECHKNLNMNLDKKFALYHKPKNLPVCFKEVQGKYAYAISGGA